MDNFYENLNTFNFNFFEWLSCTDSTGPSRTESYPAWKPVVDVNDEIYYKNKEEIKKCDNCFQKKKVKQNCIYRGNNFVFCSLDCWESWIKNKNLIKNDVESEDFFI